MGEKLPDGWTLYQSEDGKARSAYCGEITIDQIRCPAGEEPGPRYWATIGITNDVLWADEAERLLPRLKEAAAIARAWDAHAKREGVQE